MKKTSGTHPFYPPGDGEGVLLLCYVIVIVQDNTESSCHSKNWLALQKQLSSNPIVVVFIFFLLNKFQLKVNAQNSSKYRFMKGPCSAAQMTGCMGGENNLERDKNSR